MTEPNATETLPKATRHRSPAYPALDLADAVQKAEAFYKDHHLHLVPVEAAATSWNLDRSSGPGGRAISALKQFGLLEEHGENGDRRVRLSELGRRIVQLPSPDQRRKEAISEAAKKPTIHRDVLESFPTGLPPEDSALKSYLEYDRKFNRNAIEPLIKEIRDTWSFAEIEECGTMYDIMGEDLPPQEGHTMMTTATAKSGLSSPPPQIPEDRVEFQDVRIPDVRGHTAILRTPMPETEEECDYIEDMIRISVEGWKKAIARRLARQRERDKDS
jgi:hypothetical protein